MSFDWSQYLDVSQELTKQSKSSPMPVQEAQLRSAISRAYYAAFGKARRFLTHYERIPEPSRSMLRNSLGQQINIHEYVRERFKNREDDETYQEIGENLERLCKLRNIADYKLNDPSINNLPTTIQVALKWSKDIITALRELQKK